MTYLFIIIFIAVVLALTRSKAKAVVREIDSKDLIDTLRLNGAKKKRPSTFP